MTTTAILPTIGPLKTPLVLTEVPLLTRIINAVIDSPIVPSSLADKVNCLRKKELKEAQGTASTTYQHFGENHIYWEFERNKLETCASTYLSYHLNKIEKAVDFEKAIGFANAACRELDDSYYISESIYPKLIEKIAQRCVKQVIDNGCITFSSFSSEIFRIHEVVSKYLNKDIENDIRLATIEKLLPSLKGKQSSLNDADKEPVSTLALEQQKAKQILSEDPESKRSIDEINQTIVIKKKELESFEEDSPQAIKLLRELVKLYTERKNILKSCGFTEKFETYQTHLLLMGFDSAVLPQTYPEFLIYFAEKLGQIANDGHVACSLAVLARQKYRDVFIDCEDVTHLKKEQRVLRTNHYKDVTHLKNERRVLRTDHTLNRAFKRFDPSPVLIQEDLKLLKNGIPLIYNDYVVHCAKLLKEQGIDDAELKRLAVIISQIDTVKFDLTNSPEKNLQIFTDNLFPIIADGKYEPGAP